MIIDPISSCQYLSDSFKKHKIRTIALFTKPLNKIDEYMRPDENFFDKQIFVEMKNAQDIAPIVKHPELSSTRFDFIINGNEASTAITDRVVGVLLPDYANNPDTSHFRSCKWSMQEALKKAGLPHIEQRLLSPASIDGINDLPLAYPVFCKPLGGCGSMGVFRAEKFDDIRQYFKANPTGAEYLAQRLIDGVEYIVDAVSIDGVHYISCVFQSLKMDFNGTPLYRQTRVIDTPEIWSRLARQAKETLTALEVKNGFTHNEFMQAADGTLYLLECNNRNSGGKGVLSIAASACGFKSYDRLLRDHLHGSLVESAFSDKQGYATILAIYKTNRMHAPERFTEIVGAMPGIKHITMLGNDTTYDASHKLSLCDAFSFIVVQDEDCNRLKETANCIFELENLPD